MLNHRNIFLAWVSLGLLTWSLFIGADNAAAETGRMTIFDFNEYQTPLAGDDFKVETSAKARYDGPLGDDAGRDVTLNTGIKKIEEAQVPFIGLGSNVSAQLTHSGQIISCGRRTCGAQRTFPRCVGGNVPTLFDVRAAVQIIRDGGCGINCNFNDEQWKRRVPSGSCGCPVPFSAGAPSKNQSCNQGIPYFVRFFDLANTGEVADVSLELQTRQGESFQTIATASETLTGNGQEVNGNFPVSLPVGTEFQVQAEAEGSYGFSQIFCTGDGGVVGVTSAALVDCRVAGIHWCDVFPALCEITDQIPPPDDCWELDLEYTGSFFCDFDEVFCVSPGGGEITYNQLRDHCGTLEFGSAAAKNGPVHGPRVAFRLPQNQVISGDGYIHGVARSDVHGIETVRFYVDGKVHPVQNLQIRQPDPWTCSDLPNPGCDANSGFRALLPTGQLSEGPHVLTAEVPVADGSIWTLANWNFVVDRSGGGNSEIDVFLNHNGTHIPDGGIYQMGESTTPGVTISRRFRIENNGADPLVISNPDGFISDPCFSQRSAVPTTIAPGGRETFWVDLNCLQTGTLETVATILSNDADESPYTFRIRGFVDAPSFDSAASHERNIPASMTCGELRLVTLSTLNNGNTTWSEASGYRLGAVGNSDPFTSVTRVKLPSVVEVAPTEIYPFEVLLTAPQVPGTYRTDWRMVRDDTGAWFGETVTADTQVSCPPVQETLTLVADADGSVFRDNPTLTLPHDPTLYLRVDTQGQGRRSYIRFNVPQIQGTILSARLRIRARNTVPELAVYEVNNMSWSESTLNWNNQFDGGVTFSYLRSGLDLTAEQYHEIDVDEAVASGQLITIGMASGYHQDQRLYGRTSAYRPELVITYQPN